MAFAGITIGRFRRRLEPFLSVLDRGVGEVHRGLLRTVLAGLLRAPSPCVSGIVRLVEVRARDQGRVLNDPSAIAVTIWAQPPSSRSSPAAFGCGARPSNTGPSRPAIPPAPRVARWLLDAPLKRLNGTFFGKRYAKRRRGLVVLLCREFPRDGKPPSSGAVAARGTAMPGSIGGVRRGRRTLGMTRPPGALVGAFLLVLSGVVACSSDPEGRGGGAPQPPPVAAGVVPGPVVPIEEPDRPAPTPPPAPVPSLFPSPALRPVPVPVEDGAVVGFLLHGATGRPRSGRVVVSDRGGRTWTAEAGRDGRFRVPGPPRGEKVWLVVRSEGAGVFMTPEVDVPFVGDADLGWIRMEAAIDLPVRVVDGDGKPVAGATVKESPFPRDCR